MTSDDAYVRRVEPRARSAQSFAWTSGRLDTGARDFTESVEGTIRTPDHLVFVTLEGGARHLEVSTDCGHRFVGADRAGVVSFVPAGCDRKLRMRGVRARWGSIALQPSLFASATSDGTDRSGRALVPFTNVDDRFLSGLVAGLVRLRDADGALEPLYCETMAVAAAAYIATRERGPAEARISYAMPAWRLRRITEYIDAHLEDPIRLEELASLLDVSVGHLHRSFRATVGMTPLDYVNQRRIHRAVELAAAGHGSVAALALRVGFQSPSHFARVFRQVTGQPPGQLLRERASSGTRTELDP